MLIPAVLLERESTVVPACPLSPEFIGVLAGGEHEIPV